MITRKDLEGQCERAADALSMQAQRLHDVAERMRVAIAAGTNLLDIPDGGTHDLHTLAGRVVREVQKLHTMRDVLVDIEGAQ